MGFSGIFDRSAQIIDLTDILLLANVEGFERDSVLRDTGQIPLLNTLHSGSGVWFEDYPGRRPAFRESEPRNRRVTLNFPARMVLRLE